MSSDHRTIRGCARACRVQTLWRRCAVYACVCDCMCVCVCACIVQRRALVCSSVCSFQHWVSLHVGSISIAGSGSQACRKCVAGRFSGSETSARCEPCGPGWYIFLFMCCYHADESFMTGTQEFPFLLTSASLSYSARTHVFAWLTLIHVLAWNSGTFADAAGTAKCKPCGKGS